MKKWIFAILFTALCLTLGFGLFFYNTSKPQAAQFNIEGLFPGMQTHIFDTKDGHYLVGITEPDIMDSSPDFLHSDLYDIDSQLHQIPVDSDVVSAKYLSNRDIIYTSRGNLLRHSSDNSNSIIVHNVESDFALTSDEKQIIYIRHDNSEEISQLFILNVGSDESSERVIASGNGNIFWPVLTPNHDFLLFVAAFDGVVSWYRLDLNDPKPQIIQITNRGLKPGPDVLSDQFVPVPQMLESLRFIDDQTINYETGEGRISLDIMSGQIIGGDDEMD